MDRQDHKVHPLASAAAVEWGAAFSPDGHFVAYTSDESGDYQVFVQPYPPTGEKQQVSSTEGGNEEPVWSRDGRELFYRNGRRWIAVPVTMTRPRFTVGAARVLFEGDYINVPGLSYDVARDGRFLLLEPIDQPRRTDLNVVENWFEELKRKVPVN
jgi:eukaryotic-like serine/threonine-protein kinase